MSDDAVPRPEVISGIPFCTKDECPCFDGKRCRPLGFRPGNICEPAVRTMAASLEQEKARADRAEERVRELEALRIPCDLCGRTWCGGCTKHKDSFARGISMTVAEFAAGAGKIEHR